MDASVVAMYARFNRLATPPERFPVSLDEYASYEAYLEAEQDRRVAEWQAAGSPDDWHEPLGLIFLGPNSCLMFKGVELQVG